MHTHRKRPIPDIREKTPLFPFFFFGGVHIFQTPFSTLSFAGLSLLLLSFSSFSRLLFQLMSRKLFLIPRSRARTSQFRNLSRFPRLLQPCDFAFAFSGLGVVELHFVVLRRRGGGSSGGGFLVGVFGFCNFFFVSCMHLHLDMVCLEGRRKKKKKKNLLTLRLVLHHQFFRRLGQFEQLCILSFNASGFYRPKDFPLQHLVVLLDCAGSGALSHVGDWCVVLSVTNQSHTHTQFFFFFCSR